MFVFESQSSLTKIHGPIATVEVMDGISVRVKLRALHLTALIVALASVAGCGALPHVGERVQRVEDEDPLPVIVDSRGRLSPERREAIMARLEAGAYSNDLLNRQLALMESIGGKPLTAGNRVTLLVNGPAAYGAMFDAVRNAKDHIHLETFIFNEDETGRKLADLLLQKQSEGVQVNVIYDGAGSYRTSSAFFKRLREGGIQLLEFNPIEAAAGSGRSLIERDHRKILIVDGKIAFTGGINIGRGYSESIYGEVDGKEAALRWRDTDIQVEGPVVAEFQKLFLETWKRQQGPKLAERNYFPRLENKGRAIVRVVGSTPGEKNRLTYMMYVAAVLFSEKSVHLTNAYFVPDEEMLNALTDAAKRGVDVRIVLPGATDSALVFVASRSYFARLLEAGVKLYQRRDAVLHAKTGVVDGIWATVGSTNMDLWSFLRNDEVNAVVIDKDFAEKMEELFVMDLRESDRVHLEEWQNRPLIEQFLEWFARLFAHWL